MAQRTAGAIKPRCRVGAHRLRSFSQYQSFDPTVPVLKACQNVQLGEKLGTVDPTSHCILPGLVGSTVPSFSPNCTFWQAFRTGTVGSKDWYRLKLLRRCAPTRQRGFMAPAVR